MSNLVVQTNVLAINSHRNLKTVGGKLSQATARLSSGYKINSAADDAAGLAISEKMRSQIRGLDMASKNSQDAISLIQTAEGGMQEIDNMTQRIRELIVYAANDTQDSGSQSNGSIVTTQGDRQKIQDEISSLMKEIDSMAGRVEFNKKKLIDGSYAEGASQASKGQKLQNASAAAITAMSGASAAFIVTTSGMSALSNAVSAAVVTTSAGSIGSAISAAFGNAGRTLSAAASGTAGANSAISNAVSNAYAQVSGLLQGLVGKSGATAAKDAQEGIDKILASLRAAVDGLATSVPASGTSPADAANTIRTEMDLLQSIVDRELGSLNKLYGAYVDAVNRNEKASTAYSNASDASIAATKEFNDYVAVHPNWQKEVGASEGQIYFQVGANADQGWTLNIGNMSCKGLGLATGKITEDGIVQGASPTGGNIDPNSKIDVMKMTGEGDLTGLLNILDNAMTRVTTERSKLGAAQNRLEYTIKSLDITSENLTASESRIRDTDMAKEMMKMTAANVLQQAGVSMLSQANQAPQSVLSLLR